MWYKNSFRRHLCDMHIDDWDTSFLSKFSPEVYVENLKRANINSAMLYFQSHVGLCYYPTKSGKMHQGFVGKEDAMRRLVDLCHENNINVTGYYSLIYNTWAHDQYPQWRMLGNNGKSRREAKGEVAEMEFSDTSSKQARYGFCCPNNPEYRAFVKEQIKEMADYFNVEGMFYDMLFWPHMCYCEHCKKRWAEEVGGELPEEVDWNDSKWLLHIHKRRQWMGEFAQWATDITKEFMPGVSVQHNVAQAAVSSPTSSCAEEVLSACDYAGGDLYRGGFGQSFACKFYRNVTNNQPFEYMFTRCAPNLSVHTQIKSKDIMRSELFQNAANHGATLVIDAIDPVGTMDERVYTQIGEIFKEFIPYEPYMRGKAVEDIGLYYSMKSRFNPRAEPHTNFISLINTVGNLVENNYLCGVTGSFHEFEQYKLLIAPALTQEDAFDNQRIIDYVKNGGQLYFSGADNPGLLNVFFGAEVIGRTKEQIVYIAPKNSIQECFDYFDADHPLNFAGSAPIVEGIASDKVLATITLPYTHQNTKKFASIHSNPPGVKTELPAIAYIKYGKGAVLWSGVAIEAVELYEHKQLFMNLVNKCFSIQGTVESDAQENVELTLFKDADSLLLNAVLINHDPKAKKVDDFTVTIHCEDKPKEICKLPNSETVPCSITGNDITFRVCDMHIFNMYQIKF